jgi:hypothetical protein
MSGHLTSIDGLVMWRQSLALVFHHSWDFVPPIWWGEVITTSSRGLGSSLEYVPGLLLLPWLSGHVPVPPPDAYDYKLFYGDVLYVIAGAPVWAVITAVTAYLVFLVARLLGGQRRHALWALAFYGLGSPAFAAARGDTPQPLVALCWTVGIYACLKYRDGALRRWLWVSAASLAYGVLARPLEGSLVLPGLLVLLWPAWRRHPWIAVGQAGGWAAGVLITLLVNLARFGSPLQFGYGPAVAWSTPIWIGGPGALLSPGRGVLWACPALVLAGLGARALWRTGRRLEALAIAGVPTVLFLEACQYFDWVGGWDWGFRYFEPGWPLVAALAGLGCAVLPSRLGRWLPPVLLAAGVLWNIPTVTTDLLAGYGPAYADPASNWRLDAYPPIGAWRFVDHLAPRSGLDSAAIDNVWLRARLVAGNLALIPLAGLLIGAAALGRQVLASTRPATLAR